MHVCYVQCLDDVPTKGLNDEGGLSGFGERTSEFDTKTHTFAMCTDTSQFDIGTSGSGTDTYGIGTNTLICNWALVKAHLSSRHTHFGWAQTHHSST